MTGVQTCALPIWFESLRPLQTRRPADWAGLLHSDREPRPKACRKGRAVHRAAIGHQHPGILARRRAQRVGSVRHRRKNHVCLADHAQVNIALINRYFGSKKGLFAAAIPPKLTIDSLL